MEAPGTDQRRQRKRRRSVAPAPIGSESGGLNQAGQIESSLLHLLEEENDHLVQEALQAMEAKEAAGRGSTEVLYGRLLALGSQLQEYGKRLARQHASEMNMTTWPLTQVRDSKMEDERVNVWAGKCPACGRLCSVSTVRGRLSACCRSSTSGDSKARSCPFFSVASSQQYAQSDLSPLDYLSSL
jgi:formate dehydrogenase maturation protein FdhE